MTPRPHKAISVNLMNKIDETLNEELLAYQTLRLQNLITEMLQCCEDRKLYESQHLGLSYSEIKCLVLFQGQRYLTVKGIAQSLDVAKSRVTKIINDLNSKRLVESIDDPKDARIKLISLTLDGQKKVEEILAFQRQIHRKILLQINTSERKDLLTYLELLRSAMEAVKKEMV